MWAEASSTVWLCFALIIVGWLVSIYAIKAQLTRENFDASNETSMAKFAASQGRNISA